MTAPVGPHRHVIRTRTSAGCLHAHSPSMTAWGRAGTSAVSMRALLGPWSPAMTRRGPPDSAPYGSQRPRRMPVCSAVVIATP